MLLYIGTVVEIESHIEGIVRNVCLRHFLMVVQLVYYLVRVIGDKQLFVAKLFKVSHPATAGCIFCALLDYPVGNLAYKFCMLGGAQFVARYEVTDIAAFENYVRLFS